MCTQALRPGAATALDAATLEAIAGDVPSAALERGQVVDQQLVQVMVATGLQPNKSASKRMIKVSMCNIYFTQLLTCIGATFIVASIALYVIVYPGTSWYLHNLHTLLHPLPSR